MIISSLSYAHPIRITRSQSRGAQPPKKPSAGGGKQIVPPTKFEISSDPAPGKSCAAESCDPNWEQHRFVRAG